MSKDKLDANVVRLIQLNGFLCGLGVSLSTAKKEALRARIPYNAQIRRHNSIVKNLLIEAEKKDEKPNWARVKEHKDSAQTVRTQMRNDINVQKTSERLKRYSNAIKQFGIFGETEGKRLIPTTLAKLGVKVTPIGEDFKLPD